MEPGLVEPAGVASAEPAVLGQHGLAHVLAGHLLAADPDLALLTGWDQRVVLVALLDLEGRQRATHRAQIVRTRRPRGGRRGSTCAWAGHCDLVDSPSSFSTIHRKKSAHRMEVAVIPGPIFSSAVP